MESGLSDREESQMLNKNIPSPDLWHYKHVPVQTAYLSVHTEEANGRAPFSLTHAQLPLQAVGSELVFEFSGTRRHTETSRSRRH